MTAATHRERFVVIAPQGLGDCLEATPMIAALRAARPHAIITAVVLRSVARDVFAGLPHLVDEVTYLPYWERGAFAFLAAALRLPRRPRADATFLCYPAARLVYSLLLAIVPSRRRFAHAYGDRRVRRVLDPLVRRVAVLPHHNVERNGDLLAAAGIPGELPDRYSVPAGWLTERDRDGRSLVLHVGTVAHDGLEARRWPEAAFAELGRRLAGDGYRITLLAGPAEREATARVAAAIPGSEIASGTLEEAARLIGRARAVVANDNGIAHVAAGVGTPVLALFGPTPVEHGPYGHGAVAFRPSPCPPCFDILRTDSTCKLHIDYACLKADLGVDVVEARFHRLIAANRRPGDA